MRKEAGKSREQESHEAPYLSEREEGEVAEHRSLSPVAVYATIAAEGKEELERPVSSLWWSGLAAGMGISASVLAEGILHSAFEDHAYRGPIENLGYTVGFVLVILARLQLFTENTITVVLPLLSQRTMLCFGRTARLWGTVIAANFAGTFITAAVTLYFGTAPPEIIDGMLAISHHFTDLSPYECFARGIPAGFFIAALVWMLPSARGTEVLVIMLFTYVIAMGEFTHVIAGSTEAFLVMLNGEIGVGHVFIGLIGPTLLGNIVGGTGLFALLAHGQVADEIED